MKAKITLLAISSIIALFFSCTQKANENATTTPPTEAQIKSSKTEIAQLLDSLNAAAANADLEKYFSYYTEDATYNGTDATENWNKQSFKDWAKPYFDKKTTWNFTTVKRNIYFGAHQDIAWFEELVSTQMKICRGSGVVVKQDGKWKIQQYVLSMTIPNTQLDKVVSLKTAEEDSLLKSFKK
ncbi:nuclear transport factor 2 family protein [Pedobacter namyangjuensis]|uniref:nuclear transport factor 2 family protein n=1 Tax=Pedobacter namyangjuensis TaxID=600626 RepID=UPI000DE5370B|nr:nuclear transport factor 2 family protein [Pedobacter namyangjuensis]